MLNFNVDSQACRWGRLARKELRETLRDRRTILTLVLMPLLVYPVLGMTFEKFLLSQALARELDQQMIYQVAFASEAEARQFRTIFSLAGPQSTEQAAEMPAWEAIVAPAKKGTTVQTLVSGGVADVGVQWPGQDPEETRQFTLVYNPDSRRSREVKEALESVVHRANQHIYRQRLQRLGQSPDPFLAFERKTVTREVARTTMATVIPFILLLMTATGAVYPAIDLTAGERERGTLEALAAAPISPRAILGAKYVAVFVVAILTAGMNIMAMVVTAFSLRLDRFLFPGSLTIGALAAVAAFVVVMAGFFAALVLLVTSFARSFKEAQAYLIPLMMLALAPGVASLIPDLELSMPLAVTPLVGIVLLARDVLTTGTTGLFVLACLGSTILYAGVALLLAARVFGTDAVLYGSGGTWRELFRRRPRHRGVPPVTAALATLALIFPLFLLLAPLPARWESLGITGHLILNALLTLLLFALLPSITIWLSGADWHRTLSRRSIPPAAGWLAAGLLGLSLWPFAYELEILVLPTERVNALEELFAQYQDQLQAVPLIVRLATLALVPAVCEEWFFRGFFLSSLRGRFRDLAAVVITAVVFGVFHVVVHGGLFWERFIPSCLLGLVLGWVCVATGSLWPSILLHALHNGSLLTLANFEEELADWGFGGDVRTHLPASWLFVSGGVVLVGGVLLELSRRRARGRPETIPASDR